MVLIIFINLVGCNRADNPYVPSEEGKPLIAPQVASQTNRVVWSLWDIEISADRENVAVTPNRIDMMHLNTVRLLEVEPCDACLSVENIQIIGGEFVQADFRIQHPFPGALSYTAFDVRGIFISVSDFDFPGEGLVQTALQESARSHLELS